MKSNLTSLFTAFLLCFLSQASLFSQQGSEEIYKDIKKLGVLANVLYVAAHPDDENTRLISYLSNHLNVRTTYLSLTRGDGGQNLIGPEFREMLGLIRTNELLAARQIDGGHQLFTRANDFGYSKTPEETFNTWDRNEVLSDVVWAIRSTKPDVIINRFSTDTSRPNHGHHTASAILALEAFDLSGNSNSFPEQMNYVSTWQPQRIFWNTSWWFYGSQDAFNKADKSRMLAIDIGSFDAITGESNSEIAGRSRSMHKSQGFGSAETRGESLDYIDLLKDTNNKIPASLFDGIDITWNRVPGGSGIAGMVKKLEEEFDFKSPSNSLNLLMDIHAAISALDDSFWKNIKIKECEHLIQECLGLFIEVRTNKYQASPEAKLKVTVEAINRSKHEVMLQSVQPQTSDTAFNLVSNLAYNQVFLKEIEITAPEAMSTPYWLEKRPTEGMYVVEQQIQRGLPASPSSINTIVSIKADGRAFSFSTPVIYKTVDPAEGEITRPLSIIPPVTVVADNEVLMFNEGQNRKINLTLSAVEDKVQGELRLKTTDAAWKVTPESITWSFEKAGETKTIECIISPPAKSSKADLLPEIIVGDRKYHHKITTIDYDHIPYMSVVTDGTVHLHSLNIKTTPRPIAYILGAGDEVASSLKQVGFNIDVLDASSITPQVLSKYQVVILGVRAFNTVNELAYKNQALFDWVKTGGTLIAQYNVSRGLVTEQIAPYSISLSRDRITEENSPVTILNPDHEAMNFPNKITDADFSGWVQERGLYFPNKWDEAFIPLLEMKDTGENPTQGALLIAPYGDGYYVYSGLSWFRHLPAGNTGAYRILSNLIALGYKKGKS